jgi:hypothetical protein
MRRVRVPWRTIVWSIVKDSEGMGVEIRRLEVDRGDVGGRRDPSAELQEGECKKETYSQVHPEKRQSTR